MSDITEIKPISGWKTYDGTPGNTPDTFPAFWRAQVPKGFTLAVELADIDGFNPLFIGTFGFQSGIEAGRVFFEIEKDNALHSVRTGTQWRYVGKKEF